MKFYCQKDKALICQECLLASHLGHDVIASAPLLVGEAVQSKLEEGLTMLESVLKASADHVQSLATTTKEKNDQITQAGDALIQHIKELVSRSINENHERLGEATI